jgi:hypothetical protein
MSWQDIANLTHATQVRKVYHWCSCEEQEQIPLGLKLLRLPIKLVLLIDIGCIGIWERATG